MYYNIACKAAVRARDKNSLPELAALVDRLAENPQITHCPHGRPVQVTLTGNEIEKMFGRQG
jgi:DNA mismatch repair protein MutL